jgi:hypothetical protein
MNRIITVMAAACLLLSMEAGIANAQETGAKGRAAGSPFSQEKFIPDISFIADFSAVARTMSDERYGALEAPGFTRAQEGEGMNASNGFNFNYGELTLASSVDPYFDLFAAFHLSEESFEMEEAYVTTRALPLGLQLRAGKFKSGFGRINEQHTHAWDFADAPLVFRAFFSDEGLTETGGRLSWIAPLPFYLLLGGEVLRGVNEASFGNKGFAGSTGSSIGDAPAPNVKVAFARASFDVGSLSVLYGVSCALGETRTNNEVDHTGGSAVRADTGILGVDLMLRFSIDSYRYLSLQGEYMKRTMKGNRYDDSWSIERLEKKQSGLYSQLVFRMAQRWRMGYRFDLLAANKERIGGVSSGLPENLTRHTGMIEFDPSEFSRIRVQYAHDESGYLDDSTKHKTNDEVILALTMAIGAHGAHSF